MVSVAMGGKLIDKLLDAVSAAIPPADASDVHVTRWRLAVGLISMAMPLALAIHILMSCGWIGPGFAQARDLQDLKAAVEEKDQAIRSSLDKQERRQIEDALLDMRARQCAAITTGNAEAKRFAAEKMDELQSDWRALVGVTTNYPLPTCEELP